MHPIADVSTDADTPSVTNAASESAGKPSSSRVVLATCCGAHGVQDGIGITVNVLLPVFAQAFGLSYAEVGTVRAARNAVMAVLEIPAGILAERWGERILLVFGLLAAGTGFALIPLSTGFYGLALCLMVVGAGAAFQHSLSSAIVARSYPVPGRWQALGIYNSAGDAGKLVLASVATFVIGTGLGWQAVVSGFGALSMVAAAVVFSVLQRTGAGAMPAEPATRTAPAQKARGWGIQDRHGFTVIGVMVFLGSLVQGTFMTFVAFIMIEKSVPVHLAASAVVLTLIGGMLGKFSCGFLATRLGIVRSLVLVQTLAALGIVVLLLAPPLLSFCLLPVLGIVLRGASSITYSTVSNLVDDGKQSRGFALIYTVSSVASIVGPVCFGSAGDRFGLEIAMLGMAVVVLSPLALCGPLRAALSRVST